MDHGVKMERKSCCTRITVDSTRDDPRDRETCVPVENSVDERMCTEGCVMWQGFVLCVVVVRVESDACVSGDVIGGFRSGMGA